MFDELPRAVGFGAVYSPPPPPPLITQLRPWLIAVAALLAVVVVLLAVQVWQAWSYQGDNRTFDHCVYQAQVDTVGDSAAAAKLIDHCLHPG